MLRLHGITEKNNYVAGVKSKRRMTGWHPFKKLSPPRCKIKINTYPMSQFEEVEVVVDQEYFLPSD
jgi:hypothetical protein